MIYSVSVSTQGAALFQSPLHLIDTSKDSPKFYYDQFVLRYVRSQAASILTTGRIIRSEMNSFNLPF